MITLRIQQRFSVRHEREFLKLERQFIELERQNPQLPQGRRFRPLAGALPTHVLIWESDFPDLDAAREALNCFARDPEHERLFVLQSPFIEETRIEFFEVFS